MKNPNRSQGFPNTRLQKVAPASRIITSKQLQPAMTTPLYTKSIIGRKPIVFINALVSPKHCELLRLISGRTSKKHNLNCCLMGQHRVLSVSRNEVGRCPRNGQGNPSNLYISADERAVTMGEIQWNKITSV